MVKPYKHSFSVNFLLLITLTIQTVMPTFLRLIQNCNVHLSSFDTDCNVHLSSFDRDLYIHLSSFDTDCNVHFSSNGRDCYISVFLRLIQTVMSIFLGGTIFQKPNKLQKLNQNKSFSFIFHRFSSFICCLSVILWLDKGHFPENLNTVCPC